MKLRTFKPIIWLLLFILLLGMACGGPPSAEPTAVPEKELIEQPAEKPTDPPAKPIDPPAKPEVPETSGAISDIQDVKGAVIQIEAQGTFVDPEFGEYSGAGRGSGFIIDPSGIAVTNNHVVTGAALLKVWVGGDTGKTYNARILGVSECSDLAVIDIEGDGFPYLEWYDQPIKVGLDVYTAGFPLGEPEYTLTKGIVSKESADGETNWASVDSVIMHDATINPGNSGGPLVDQNGKIVGINYAAYKTADQYFAIGPEEAISIVKQLQNENDVDSIGINGTAVVSEDGALSGIWVTSVRSGSPANNAGITGGDIITELEGFPLASDGTMADYCDIIRTHKTSDTVSLEVLRFSTSEFLEGQLNGQVLETSYSFADNIETDTDQGANSDAAGGSTYSAFYTVYDEMGAITVDVPNEWDQVDDTLWENSWGTMNFSAASVIATTNFDDYNNWAAPGVWFSASKDWGNIGGYIQLLDGVKGWYEDDCTLDGRYDYGEDDPIFEGGYDLWTDCGAAGSMNIVVGARPKSDPFAYLVLVQVQVLSDADLEALDQILATFDQVGPLP